MILMLTNHQTTGDKKMSYENERNFETWKVKLEIFDGLELDHKVDEVWVEEYADMRVFGDDDGTSLMADYAMRFLSDVYWYSVADTVNEYNKERIAENKG